MNAFAVKRTCDRIGMLTRCSREHKEKVETYYYGLRKPGVSSTTK